MPWISRPALETALRRALDEPGPALLALRGRPRSGRSGLVRRVAGTPDRSTLAVVGRPGPGGLRSLREAWARAGLDPGLAGTAEPASVEEVLLRDLEARRHPRVLVVDDLPRWVSGDPEARRALMGLWTGARARALPLHVVVVGPDDPSFDTLLAELFEGADARSFPVGPLSGAEVRGYLPEWSPAERYLLGACLGGSPETLSRVDPAVRAATNLQRLVVDPDGEFHGLPPRRLGEQFQKPARYAGVLRALAAGAREWGEIRRTDPSFPSGNQLAPYLATLQETGWVETSRSLDAAPESRKRRYRLADPFTAFWYAVVEPAVARLLEGAGAAAVWRDLPVDRHAERWFPDACLQALAERGGEFLPVGARETGGLWGDGYDFPVAGTLTNGAAVYGVCAWERATAADADHATAQMRATRYGFGRQARLRLVFTAAPPDETLIRRAARDPLIRIVALESLF